MALHRISDNIKFAIENELSAQDTKWGADRDLPNWLWHLIMDEETGEASKACLYLVDDSEGMDATNKSKLIHLEDEVTQVVAVGIQWLESIERQKKKARG